MIRGLTVLIFFQLLGDAVSHYGNLIIPGPVIGMVLLLTFLFAYKKAPQDIDQAGSTLLKYIGLLFVPAGAGISMYLTLIVQERATILVASFVTTVVVLILTAVLFLVFAKKEER